MIFLTALLQRQIYNSNTVFCITALESDMKTKLIEFLKDEEGATAIEYALIAALIAVVIITALTAMGDTLKGVFNDIVTKLGGTPGD
ncbi:protein of unknown function [Thauera humireducens]|nr:protein of unknown function [Thauera humireducens]